LERFQHLWNWLAHPSRAGEVEMGSCDLIRFLRWLSRNGLALFHGTDRIDLEQLTPDHLPPVSAGEVEAEEYVSASSDPLCSVFLSIVEREVATAPGTHR